MQTLQSPSTVYASVWSGRAIDVSFKSAVWKMIDSFFLHSDVNEEPFILPDSSSPSLVSEYI